MCPARRGKLSPVLQVRSSIYRKRRRADRIAGILHLCNLDPRGRSLQRAILRNLKPNDGAMDPRFMPPQSLHVNNDDNVETPR